ncbi:type II toxin-antitoxin system HicA family toxin [Clostridium brassicae]|uniref:Type II toxin-antitoxin system HicA family toxin n=1 Tax=Clostridium brassicae TaxID=2999072 RepID=A0ABT4D813_9CLOT|nr:type II toxin-antitoxin system HicA family toxin [Clostridium brassicae]MCY6958298.1 type II toxin-antitoxin system HicA family toxin [Clostridium brassicae]
MKPLEIKLNRQFLKLQKGIEDFWCMDGNDSISEFADKIGREKYFEIRDIGTEIEEECKSEDFTIEKCNKLINDFVNKINNFNKYLYNPEITQGFKKDLFESVGEKSKKMIDEIKMVQALAYYSNLQKLANKIECRTWQTIGRITYILNTVLDEVMNPYKKAIDDEITKVKEILDKKAKEIKLKTSKEKTEEVSKITTKKIFNYKEMDKLIKLNGYEPIRRRGDHKIYTNGTKSIPIPQHTLGKGLSCKIQKQIV